LNRSRDEFDGLRNVPGIITKVIEGATDRTPQSVRY
jgi:hypothetical protein